MFGKTKDTEAEHGGLAIDPFFGDEDGAAETASLEVLQDRVEHVEQQLSSQFTSLAAYAQIAQEQIETARSEAKHTAERTERRVTELIERERADRIAAMEELPVGGGSPSGWTAPGTDDRLDALERTVAQIQHGLNECLARQKALADAIAALFEPQVADQNLDCRPPAGTDASTLPPPAETGTISELSIL